ncbi:hypothetical protein LX32DRAFT_506985, partial [Colletotrichum zoysiae]
LVNKETVSVLDKYQENWEKLHPGADRPEKLTIDPSDSAWSSFKTTPFFKAVNYTFKPTKKTVVSM